MKTEYLFSYCVRMAGIFTETAESESTHYLPCLRFRNYRHTPQSQSQKPHISTSDSETRHTPPSQRSQKPHISTSHFPYSKNQNPCAFLIHGNRIHAFSLSTETDSMRIPYPQKQNPCTFHIHRDKIHALSLTTESESMNFPYPQNQIPCTFLIPRIRIHTYFSQQKQNPCTLLQGRKSFH